MPSVSELSLTAIYNAHRSLSALGVSVSELSLTAIYNTRRYPVLDGAVYLN